MTAVLAIVEEGTFSRAAEALGVSQPALSKSIALLERRIGAKVFERTPRGSTLTDTGRIIARRAEGIRILLARAQDEIALKSKGLQGTLNIGGTPSLMLSLVPDALARTLSQYPGLVVHLQEGLDDTLTPLLQRGELDLLVGPVAGLHPVSDELAEEIISIDRYFIAIRKSHRLVGRSTISLRELIDHPWILPIPGSSFYRSVEALFIAAGLTWPKNVLSTNCLYANERMISKTDRVGIITSVQCMEERSDLVTIPLEDDASRFLGVKMRNKQAPSAATETFISHLKSIAVDMAP